MIRTPFTTLFGVDHPIVCGGMTGLGTAPLISAVAEEVIARRLASMLV